MAEESKRKSHAYEEKTVAEGELFKMTSIPKVINLD